VLFVFSEEKRDLLTLANSSFVLLIRSLKSDEFRASVLFMNENIFADNHEYEKIFGHDVDFVLLKEGIDCLHFWLQSSYKVFETIRELEFDLIISEDTHGPLSMYAGFSSAHAPVITYTDGGTYENKIANSESFENETELLYAALEDMQLRKSEIVVVSSPEALLLYRSLNVPMENFRVFKSEKDIDSLKFEKLEKTCCDIDSWLSLMDEVTTSNSTEKQTISSAPTISVIISTKNRQNFLPQALNSCLNQTLQPDEIIVIDDGSTDSSATQNIVEMFSKDLKIRLFRNEVSEGQAKARNKGARLATSEVIAFLDDDNYLLSRHLELCLETITTQEAEAAATFMNRIYSDYPLHENSDIDSVTVFCGDHYTSLSKVYNLVCDTHIAIRRDFFLTIGGFPDHLRSSQEDWGLGLLIISKGGKFKSTGTPTIMYRLNNDGVWAKGNGVRKWWPLHTTSSLIHSPEWWYDELVRLSVYSEKNLGKFKKQRRLFYAWTLIKQGDFKTLASGLFRVLRKMI
jgi:glycosyltransferase involved in cell wall biosynthesis